MSENYGLTIIAQRYATAMIDLAEKKDLFDIMDNDLKIVKETLLANKELLEFFEHPLIEISDKKEVLEQVFKDKVSEYCLNLMKIMAERSRIYILPYVAVHYHKLLNEKRKVSVAKVITAIDVDEETLDRVREKLKNTFNKNIEIDHAIDEDIIAGMVVKLGDKVIDGSVRSKIENMKKQLI